MKPIRILLILITAALLTACHSQKNVSKKPVKTPQPVELNGKADNKYTRQLMSEAYSWLGTPYKYGGVTKKGADCSGFVMTIYKNSLGIDLPRVSREQGDFCRKINKKDLFPGDLVFFSSGKGKVNHVGLYVGDNKILHASSSQGVVVSDLSVNYFTKHFHHAGMVPAYRKKALASAKSRNSEKANTNKDKTKHKKQKKVEIHELPASPSPISGDVPEGAIEIPASQLFKTTPKDRDKNNTNKEVTPLPDTPAISPDSTIEIQADTVHLMVYFR